MEIDTTKPNAGRIYDYFLGGHHNFEVDRAAAEQLMKLLPSVKAGAQLNRSFMYEAMRRLAQGGFDCYLDLATGLPTEGYLHDLAPSARILYNDIDPATVAYGRKIVADKTNVRYVQSNVADIDTILQAAAEHFGAQRRIGICFVGAAYLFEKDTLRHILGRLYDWCSVGSQLVLSLLAGDAEEVKRIRNSQFAGIYRRMNSPVYFLELAEIDNVIGNWRIDTPGLLTLGQWVGVEQWRVSGGEEEEAGDIYGMLLTKD